VDMGWRKIFPPPISMTSGPRRKDFPPISSTNVGIFLPHYFLIKTYEAHSLFLLFDNNLSIASTLVWFSTFFRRCVTIESSLPLVHSF
jgi:hypothetical protein